MFDFASLPRDAHPKWMNITDARLGYMRAYHRKLKQTFEITESDIGFEVRATSDETRRVTTLAHFMSVQRLFEYFGYGCSR